MINDGVVPSKLENLPWRCIEERVGSGGMEDLLKFQNITIAIDCGIMPRHSVHVSTVTNTGRRTSGVFRHFRDYKFSIPNPTRAGECNGNSL